MRIMGVEFRASEMLYVVVETDGATFNVLAANRMTLSDTRSRRSLVSFQSAISATLNDAAPDRIAVKAKPENGRMRAGAAALKMEGILLANAACEVQFISGARIKKVADHPNELHAYLQPALKTALATD